MRFIHIADVHVGAHPDAGKAYSGNRSRELLDSLKRIVEECEKERIELLLIAGGLFHRQPLRRELKEINYMFSKLSVTKVVFVVGNTDYLRENAYYRSFDWAKNVYPILTADVSCVEIDEMEVAVYGCSYHEKVVEEKKLLQKVPIAKKKYHILLGYGGKEQCMPFEKEELLQLPYDYIALGWQHRPEIIEKDKIAYAGSLEPIRLEDTGIHGYIKGQMQVGADGSVCTTIELVEFAIREYINTTIEVTPSMTDEQIRNRLIEVRMQRGMQHMYLIELVGKRNPTVSLDLDSYDRIGNVVEITDKTHPYYDLKALVKSNKDNLLGSYIKSFGQVKEGSIEYMALYEGVEAIEETKKG